MNHLLASLDASITDNAGKNITMSDTEGGAGESMYFGAEFLVISIYYFMYTGLIRSHFPLSRYDFESHVESSCGINTYT